MTYFYFFIIMFLFFSPNVYAYNIFSLEHFLSHTYHSVNLSLFTQITFFLLLLVIFPCVILTMTCFTRILIILGFLKKAIGFSSCLPNKILVCISLFLTCVIMQPSFNKIYANSYIPFINNQINIKTAINKGMIPLKEFMSYQTDKTQLLEFSKLIHIKFNNTIQDSSIRVLVPVFMINELTFAFKIGLIILVPFLIIDLLVSSILMLFGIIMIPTELIAIPLKLIFFYFVNGYTIFISFLVRSFSS